MKKIAVVLCGMEYSNQQELVQGMIQYQSEHGGSIHVFHCSGDHLQTGGYKRGAFKIFDLLNPQNYDGIIWHARHFMKKICKDAWWNV